MKRLGDDGVSSVVSAVLVFSLLSSALLLWTVTTLPEWIEDREDSHLDEARTSLAGLQTDLQRLAVDGGPGPAAATLPLSAPRVPLLQPTATRGSLELGGAFSFQADFSGGGVHVLDGAVYGTPSAPADGTGPVDVHKVETLVAAFTTSGVDNDNDAAFLTIAATDGTDTVTLLLGHGGAAYGTADCGREVRTLVITPSGTQDQILLCGAGTALSAAFTVDLLEPRFGVAAALARLQPGYDVTVTPSTAGDGSATVSGAYAAVWRDGEGRTRVAGTGNPAAYAVDEAGASLAFRPGHQELVRQDLVWEGGALLVAQDDGEAVFAAPAFELGIDAANATGFLRWTVTTLAGDGSLQGSGLAQVFAGHQATTRVVLTCTDAAFTLTSDHAAAWRAFLRDEVQASGAADAAWGGSGDTATLTLGTGAVSRWIVDLRVVEATITLR